MKFQQSRFIQNAHNRKKKESKKIPMTNLPPHILSLDEILKLIRKNYGEALDQLADL